MNYEISVIPGRVVINSIDPIKVYEDVIIFTIDCITKRAEVDAQGTTLYLEAGQETLHVDTNYEHGAQISIKGLDEWSYGNGGWRSVAQGGRYSIVWILYRWKPEVVENFPRWEREYDSSKPYS